MHHYSLSTTYRLDSPSNLPAGWIPNVCHVAHRFEIKYETRTFFYEPAGGVVGYRTRRLDNANPQTRNMSAQSIAACLCEKMAHGAVAVKGEGWKSQLEIPELAGVEEINSVPQAIVDFGASTKEGVVLCNAVNMGEFTGSSYIRHEKIKSLIFAHFLNFRRFLGTLQFAGEFGEM
jgi:hypothetical protein